MKNHLEIINHTLFRKFLSICVYLLLSNIPSIAASACDKSRKAFEGVTFGEVTHGLNSNYSQVRLRFFEADNWIKQIS